MYAYSYSIIIANSLFDFTLNQLKFAYCGAYSCCNRGWLCYIHLFTMRLSAGQRGLGFKCSLGLYDGLSFRPFTLSLSSLLSCSSLLASVKENFTQHYGDSAPRGDGVASMMPSYQAFRLPPSSVSCFVPLLPLQSTLPPLPPLAAPDLILHLCVLQPLDTFSDSSPSVGRQRAFQPGGHNAAILTNQWQINQCYLFFPCLCCH